MFLFTIFFLKILIYLLINLNYKNIKNTITLKYLFKKYSK